MNMISSTRIKVSLIALILLPVMQGCASIQEIAALREVEFDIDNVSDAILANIQLDDIRGVSDINPMAVLDLTSAVRDKNLPLQFQLHVAASNPSENNVSARLVGLDWTLFIDNRETVSGTLNQNTVMPPGQRVDIPIGIQLELFEFFDHNLPDMLDLALNIAGIGGEPKQLMLRATPTIDTPLGPIRYPGTIEILDRRVGSSE